MKNNPKCKIYRKCNAEKVNEIDKDKNYVDTYSSVKGVELTWTKLQTFVDRLINKLDACIIGEDSEYYCKR